ETAKQQRDDARETAKQQRDDIKEFKDSVVVTSSSSSSVEKVTICHVPPGNPDNAHTITVGSPAVRAHEAHGDYITGSCEDEGFNPDDYESKKESRSSENENKESKALERAQKLIEKLEQQISDLEDRLQKLLEKYESGEYYGNISEEDSEINTFEISFDGTATSIYNDSVTDNMSGKLFMENQVTKQDTTKFKITSGEIEIGGDIYDVAFGKARLSSSGSGGEEDSLVVVMQTIDSLDNENTVKMTLGFTTSLEGEFGNPSEEFEILDNSKISEQWFLDGNGELFLKP
ncbi:MAG: hypothetical protein ACO3K2_08255, partial [Nitrosopumilaceae archaeon]